MLKHSNLFKKTPPIFWFQVFKKANTLSPLQTKRVRMFIKCYISYSYFLPVSIFSSGLKLNLIIPFQNSVSRFFLKCFHSKIFDFLSSKHKKCFDTPYCTFSSSKKISSCILNFKKFFRSFDRNLVPTCSCGSLSSNPADHKIIMPKQMNLKHRLLVRNIEEPLMSTPHCSLFKIVSQCLIKIDMISKLKIHPSRNLPFSLSTYDHLVSLTLFFYATYSVNISFNLFVICTSSIPFDPFNFDVFITTFVNLSFSSVPLYTPSAYEYMNALLWLFGFQLFSLFCSPLEINCIVSDLVNSVVHFPKKSSGHIFKYHIHDFLSKYKGYIFL